MSSKCLKVSEKHYLDICLLRFLISMNVSASLMASVLLSCFGLFFLHYV